MLNNLHPPFTPSSQTLHVFFHVSTGIRELFFANSRIVNVVTSALWRLDVLW